MQQVILQIILSPIMGISYTPKVPPEIFYMESLSRTYCRKRLQFHRYMEYLLPWHLALDTFYTHICAQNYLLPIVQKGAKNTINITNDTFISSKLYLPLDVEEQKAIADTFIAADREIDLLRQDIEQEKQKKKALMQLLLTGIVRV